MKFPPGRLWAVVLSGALAASIAPAVASGATRHATPAFSVRLEDQILAELDYLPVRFVSATASRPPVVTTTTTSTTTTTVVGSTTTTTTTSPTSTTTSTTTTTLPIRKPKPVDPATLQRGHFVWRFTSLPARFKVNWQVGTNNVILRGALMRFQGDHGLVTTGSMDGTTWRLLVVAARQHRQATVPYAMVLVTQGSPETLQLFQNGHVTMHTLVNTGISVAPTQNGTFPVYLRYTTTTMSGTLPNGQPYHDTGIPWVSYFNGGDALHGFLRGGYGYPQSLGCVEMTYAAAGALWPHTPIGTLVTVQP